MSPFFRGTQTDSIGICFRPVDPRASDAPTIFELMDQHKITEISRRAVEVLTTAAELAQKEGWSEVSLAIRHYDV